MIAPRELAVLIGFGLGCASTSPPVDTEEVQLPPPTAVAVAPSLAPSASAGEGGKNPNRVEVAIPTGGVGKALGLTIEVLENIEKRTMEGSSLMRVSLRVIDGFATHDVHFESPGNEQETWGRYRFTYRGGWRSEVVVDVERLPDE